MWGGGKEKKGAQWVEVEKAEKWKMKLTCRPQLLVSTSGSTRSGTSSSTRSAPLSSTRSAPLSSTERRDGCNQEEDASHEGGTFIPKSWTWKADMMMFYHLVSSCCKAGVQFVGWGISDWLGPAKWLGMSWMIEKGSRPLNIGYLWTSWVVLTSWMVLS